MHWGNAIVVTICSDDRKAANMAAFRFRVKEKLITKPEKLERGCAGFGDRVVLVARATAYADGSNYLAAALQRDTAGEDHDLAVIRGMDAEELPTRLGVGPR